MWLQSPSFALCRWESNELTSPQWLSIYFSFSPHFMNRPNCIWWNLPHVVLNKRRIIAKHFNKLKSHFRCWALPKKCEREQEKCLWSFVNYFLLKERERDENITLIFLRSSHAAPNRRRKKVIFVLYMCLKWDENWTRLNEDRWFCAKNVCCSLSLAFFFALLSTENSSLAFFFLQTERCEMKWETN